MTNRERHKLLRALHQRVAKSNQRVTRTQLESRQALIDYNVVRAAAENELPDDISMDDLERWGRVTFGVSRETQGVDIEGPRNTYDQGFEDGAAADQQAQAMREGRISILDGIDRAPVSWWSNAPLPSLEDAIPPVSEDGLSPAYISSETVTYRLRPRTPEAGGESQDEADDPIPANIPEPGPIDDGDLMRRAGVYEYVEHDAE